MSREVSSLLGEERLRSRLSHDLVRNQFVLGLSGLRNIIRGEVEAACPRTELFEHLKGTWAAIRNDWDILRRGELGRWLDRELPFVRRLSAQDVEGLRGVIKAQTISPAEDLVAEIESQLGQVARALGALESAIAGDELGVLERVDDALAEARHLALLLGRGRANEASQSRGCKVNVPETQP